MFRALISSHCAPGFYIHFLSPSCPLFQHCIQFTCVCPIVILDRGRSPAKLICIGCNKCVISDPISMVHAFMSDCSFTDRTTLHGPPVCCVIQNLFWPSWKHHRLFYVGFRLSKLHSFYTITSQSQCNSAIQLSAMGRSYLSQGNSNLFCSFPPHLYCTLLCLIVYIRLSRFNIL